MLGSSKEGKIRSAPAYTIVGRLKDLTDPSTNFPGPGKYDAQYELLVRKPPHYSMGLRVGMKDKSYSPGPAAHSPEKVGFLILTFLFFNACQFCNYFYYYYKIFEYYYRSIPAPSFGIKHSIFCGNKTVNLVPFTGCQRCY